jgi:superfamily I DNA/RNA helicase
MQYVGNGKGSFAGVLKNKDTILMTYHSAKGLDFDNVFIPFLTKNLQISQTKPLVLFMVAMTRSKKNLYLTYSNDLHSYVDKFRKECTEINIAELINPVSSTSVDFDF